MPMFSQLPQQQPGMFGSMMGGISPYSNRLMMAGLGLMNNGWGGAAAGLSRGYEMDADAGDRREKKKREAMQLRALNDAMQAGDLGQMSPTMQGLVNANPELGMQVAQSRLSPQSSEFASAGDGTIFNRSTGEFKSNPNGGSYYRGTSVDAQAYNHLLEQGYTREQIDQLAGGRVVTDPSTGALTFMRPQDLIGAGTGQQSQAAPQQAPMPQGQGQQQQAGGVGVQLTPGKPNKAKSQDQVKGEVLIANAEADFQQADQLFNALGNSKDLAAGYGGSLGRFFQSPDYQVASDSIVNVVQSYIYAVSGAQAPEQEVQRNAKLVTPTLMDSPKAREAKRRRLEAMMEAIRVKAREGTAPPPGADEGWQDLGNGVRIREMP